MLGCHFGKVFPEAFFPKAQEQLIMAAEAGVAAAGAAAVGFGLFDYNRWALTTACSGSAFLMRL